MELRGAKRAWLACGVSDAGGGDELLDVIFFGGACYLLDMGQGCHIMNGVSGKLTCEVSVANFV